MNKDNNRTCGRCRHCTPYTEFRTLNLDGEPTMGTCPYWTSSKCVLLSLDTCIHFDIAETLSAETESCIIEKERDERREMLIRMREEFVSNNAEVLPTLPYGKEKKGKRKK